MCWTEIIDCLNSNDCFAGKLFVGIISLASSALISLYVAKYAVNKRDKAEQEKLDSKSDELYEYFKSISSLRLEKYREQLAHWVMDKDKLEITKNLKFVKLRLVVQDDTLFDTIDKIDLYQSFSKRKVNTDKLVELMTDFESLRASQTYIVNAYREYHELVAKRRSQWFASMKELLNAKTNQMGKYGISSLSNHKHIVKLNNDYNEFVRKQNPEIHFAFEELINPLDKYFKSIYPEYHQNPDVTESISILTDLCLVYDQGEKERVQIYQELDQNFAKVLKLIQNIESEIKKL